MVHNLLPWVKVIYMPPWKSEHQINLASLMKWQPKVRLKIAVLVGARGLAEQVNIGLRSGDTGLGLTAGLSMAFIAIMADRILRAWANKLGAED